MITFKVTFDCAPGIFKAEELYEALKDFTIMKIKTEGIKLGKVTVIDLADEKTATKGEHPAVQG